MSATQIVLLAVLFVIVFAIAVLVLRLVAGTPVKGRLEALEGKKIDVDKRKTNQRWVARLISLTKPLAKLSLPEDGWETSPIRIRFINAGWRNSAAPALFYAAKTGLALLFPLVTFFVLRGGQHNMLLWLVGVAALGYYLPDIALKHSLKVRQREIFETFPDALDLMTVCVEAGLAMDAALARVAQEIGLKSEILAEELQLVTLELRAGSAKDKALRNLALRDRKSVV